MARKMYTAEYRSHLVSLVEATEIRGSYAWLQRGPCDRVLQDGQLLAAIRQEHLASRGIYGAPRIRAMLKRRGHGVGRKRVAQLMLKAGVVGVTRRSKHRTTIRDERARPAPDLVDG